jgi:hypothetical protein
VIDWQGRLYLEDGHHRTTRAALNGEHTIEARVLTISDEARDTLLEAHGNRAATG